MTTPFDTVREALEAALSDDQPYLLQCGKALTALDQIEANHAHDLATAAAQGFRDGVASVQQPQAEAVPDVVCDKDPQGCWNVRCQLGKVCKNAAQGVKT